MILTSLKVLVTVYWEIMMEQNYIGDDENVWAGHGPALNGKNLYRRIFIRRKDVKTDAD